MATSVPTTTKFPNVLAKNLLEGKGLSNMTAPKVLAVTSSYTYDGDHNTVSDVESHEVDTGDVASYARIALVIEANATQDDTANLAKIGWAAATFGSLEAGATIGGFWVYDAVADVDATDELTLYISLDTARATNGAEFQLPVTTNAINIPGTV